MHARPAGSQPGDRIAEPWGARRPFGPGEAANPAGRAILKAADHQPPHEPPTDEYPLLFSTGRSLHHFHTRTKTARAPQLDRAVPAVWVELSAADAERHGIREGDLVRVESRRGQVQAQALVVAR